MVPSDVSHTATATCVYTISIALIVITVPQPDAQSIPQTILLLNHSHRQRLSDAEKHEQEPLPAEGVDQRDKDEPVDQLRVGEEVECFGRRERFDRAGEVDPAVHPVGSRCCEWINEEHE